ncbi:hypothetical protein TIFTF001_006584 [Ficus carica]|uniref:Phytocyanin domain-containing protein n=1 Tax=Ficus carica TaxID=3494 RepID=A0AA87ZND7_FICCA|nr:hypothetical protein TIFTF001_006584 [Ficus carica]
MASSSSSCSMFLFNSLMMLFFLFMIMNAPPLEASRDFKVGDDSGWLEPDINNVTLYNQWAGKNRFQIGDSLVFEYSNDSVLVVDKWGYYHCDNSKPIIAFNNGNSTVKLNRPGLFYFISGASDHCKKGQRMIVDVMSPRSPRSANAPSGSYSAPSPFPSHSSGDSVSVTCSSLVMALILVANIASLA